MTGPQYSAHWQVPHSKAGSTIPLISSGLSERDVSAAQKSFQNSEGHCNMASKKRIATSELNHDNWDQDDDAPEDVRSFDFTSVAQLPN